MKYKDIINSLDNYSKYGNGFTKEDAVNAIKIIEDLKNEKIKLIEEYKNKLINEIQMDEDCAFQCHGCLYECKYSIPYIIDIATHMIENIEKRHVDSSNWISVKDRLPEDYVEVLAYNSRKNEVVISTHDSTSEEWDCELMYDAKITYWQPLPKLPDLRKDDKYANR